MPPFELWIRVVGCDEETYDANSSTAIELVIGVVSFDPDEESLRQPEEGWNAELWENPLARMIWKVDTLPYTLVPSAQDEGDLRLFWIWRRKKSKWLAEVHLPRQDAFYTALTGFTADEITRYGLSNMLAFGGFATMIPIVVTDYSKQLNTRTGVNRVSFTIKSTRIID